ncbi:MAG: GNAT family N-acetyltransferase [Aestuariivirga sp.]
MNDIESERLILRLVPLSGLAATAARDAEACRRIIGVKLHEDWFDEAWVSELRLKQWKDDPEYAPWSIRAIALKRTGEIVGNINCHGNPESFEHGGETGLAIEMGYTIFPPWRRLGFAFEAITVLSTFASGRGVRWVRLSIAPDNAASLALALRLGAFKTGSHIDERNGPEDIYLFETD